LEESLSISFAQVGMSPGYFRHRVAPERRSTISIASIILSFSSGQSHETATIVLAACLAAPLAAQPDAAGLNYLGPWSALDFAKLNACRPEPVSNQEKQSLLASLPERGEVKNLTEDQKRKLSSLNAVLALHARNDVYVVKVIDVPQAWTGLYGRGVLLISAALLNVVSSGELQALVAHDLTRYSMPLRSSDVTIWSA
jgi:hypothetical protein